MRHMLICAVLLALFSPLSAVRTRAVPAVPKLWRLHGGYDGGGWTQHMTAEGQPYYYNSATGESAWELPVNAAAPPPAPAANVWTVHATDEGQTFYFNEATGESAWQLPPGAVLAPAAQATGYEGSGGNNYYGCLLYTSPSPRDS